MPVFKRKTKPGADDSQANTDNPRRPAPDPFTSSRAASRIQARARGYNDRARQGLSAAARRVGGLDTIVRGAHKSTVSVKRRVADKASNEAAAMAEKIVYKHFDLIVSKAGKHVKALTPFSQSTTLPSSPPHHLSPRSELSKAPPSRARSQTLTPGCHSRVFTCQNKVEWLNRSNGQIPHEGHE